METDKYVHQVNIAGLPLRLRSTHDQEMVDQLVRLVDEKVQAALEKGSTRSFQKALLIASLNLADELLQIKRDALEHIRHIESRAEQILVDLESAPIERLGLDN